MDLAVGYILGHYRLVEKLGEGGMGVVWKARDLKLERDIAIKVLREGVVADPGRRAFFEREAKAVAALHHPNIVTIYTIAEAENVHFFTMELVDGEPLSKFIVPGGVPLDLFFKIAVPLVDAVAAAHERGILHRDLKPMNIMIDPAGKVKILDFGLAQILEPVPAFEGIEKARTATLEGAFTGTISYMSPEQLRNEALDHRTDLFSLGIILYELATGEHPFGGKTLADTIAAILEEEPQPAFKLNAKLPRPLDRILQHCLDKDRWNRTASAVDLRDEMELMSRSQSPGGVAEIPSILDPELFPDDARALYMGANGLVALGEREKGLEWARRAKAIAPEQPMLLYNLGCIYSLAGEIDEALDCLERAVTHGFIHKEWFEHDSNLDPLRSHPRFLAMMEKLG